MTLRDKILDPASPVIFFEQVPPAADNPDAIDATLAEVGKLRTRVDAINLPEILDESRGAERTYRFVPRVDPRLLGARIRRELATEVVINHVVVSDPDPLRWFRESQQQAGIQNVILVGGQSSQVSYPGPSVRQAAEQVRAAGLPVCLGGITIPTRNQEPEGIRAKQAAGLDFFTSQILFDSNDIVWLMQRLNGLEARLFLSFAPVSHPGDLKFLRWLGVDLPAELDRYLLAGSGTESCLARSLDLAQRILMDVFDNLPPDPPLLGLNIEHINQRNYRSAIKMLEQLGGLYSRLVAARARSARQDRP
jgi:5,10-methylenetetrahydrofolate reductase